MKTTKKIIGLMLVLIMSANLSIPSAYALTEAETKCQAEKKNLDKAYLMEGWEKAEVKDQEAYQEAVNEMQFAYHHYVGCLFNFAEATVLMSDGNSSGGTIDSNLLNTGSIPVVGTLIDWMVPDQACLTSEELKKVIQKSEPTQMLTPILGAHAEYKKHLQKIGKEFDASAIITDKKGEQVTGVEALKIKTAQLETIKRNRQLEIDSALVAIDLMFTSLKELRLAFVMHVHFQCTLKFLEKYKRALEEMRTVVVPLPDQLEDASITK